MKRFISLAMASVMAASLLPATAFAATGDAKATAKVVGSENYTEQEMESTDGKIDQSDAAELQMTFTTADYASTSVPDAEIELTLDNAEFLDESGNVIDEDSTTLENLDELIYLKDDDNIQYSLVWDDTDSVAYFQDVYKRQGCGFQELHTGRDRKDSKKQSDRSRSTADIHNS